MKSNNSNRTSSLFSSFALTLASCLLLSGCTFGVGFSGDVDTCAEFDANYGEEVAAYDCEVVHAHSGSLVDAYEGSTVYAYSGSIVYAHYGSFVEAYPGSSVYAEYGSEVVYYY